MIARVVLTFAVPLVLVLVSTGCTDRQRESTSGEARERTRTAERKMDNATTTAAVKSKLAADVRLSTLTSINVDSSGSTVTLSGRVPTSEDKRKAEDVARSVDGVATVLNKLEVAP